MTQPLICSCGLLKVRKAGTHVVDGHEVCNICERPLQFTPEGIAATAPIAMEMVTTLDFIPGYVIERSCGLVTELTSAAGFTAASKGKDAFGSAMPSLLAQTRRLGGNAIVGLKASTFAAGGGITNVLGGDAVGVLLMGTAVTVVEET
jgi:uncharacterized protein YbjQ (UPF0145 family)